MNWDAVGAIAELLGAIGVILSLVYLATQIRQNTRSVRAAAYQGLAELTQSMNVAIFSDSETGELLERLRTTTGPLETTERRRWLSYISAVMRHCDNIYYQRSVGVLEQSRFEGLLGPLRFNLLSQRFRDDWEAFKPSFDPEFVAFIEQLSIEAHKDPPAA